MKRILLSTLLACFTFIAISQSPTINSLDLLSSSVEMNSKMEIVVDLEATYDNPYSYDEVSVKGIFTAPSGIELEIDGFYMEPFNLNTSNGNLSSGGAGEFRVRFAPMEMGQHDFIITVTDANGTVQSEVNSFMSTAKTNDKNKGYIRTNQTNYLNYDDGDQYIAIGENIAWQNGNKYTSYNTWLTNLAQSGGNFFRLWQAHWGYGIEWGSNYADYEGMRQYHQRNSSYQDWMLDFCEENGLYIMFCIQHHGQVSTGVNPEWNTSPYNIVNGGPCTNTMEFFTNEEARDHTKNRLKYIIARWGYSPNIMTWELFNEAVWTDNFENIKDDVDNWHYEMAAFMKDLDVYDHLMTTSFGSGLDETEVWRHEDFDFSQTHFYVNTASLEKALVNGNQLFLEEFKKPTLNGEFGLGGNANLANEDPDGIHLHNSMWGSLFGGGLGTAMSWWWDNYIEPRDLYYHFTGLSLVANEVPFMKGDMHATTTSVTGAPGDLILGATLGWAGIGDMDITIGDNGVLTPANPGLGQFLYGSQWNTDFRAPPSFTVFYDADGSFIVNTGDGAGTDARISIHLDDVLILDEVAATNTEYKIDIPAGAHKITVDNLGTDWLNIASYIFEGLGSLIDSYSLLSSDGNKAAGWVLNNAYNHVNVVANGAPTVVNDAVLNIPGLVDGTYTIEWFDCLSGDITDSETVSSAGGANQFSIPELVWDKAYVIKNDAVGVRDIAKNIDFEVYPSPASIGQELIVNLEPFSGDLNIEIYNLEGKIIFTKNAKGGSKQSYRLPSNISAGFHFVRVSGKSVRGTKGIMIFE